MVTKVKQLGDGLKIEVGLGQDPLESSLNKNRIITLWCDGRASVRVVSSTKTCIVKESDVPRNTK